MQTSSIQSIYRDCLHRLKQADIDDSEQTVRFIIEHVFCSSYLNLIAQDVIVTDSDRDQIYDLLQQCLNGTPLAYVLGSVQFLNNTYSIQPGVLIPRPETEELVRFAEIILTTLISSNHVPDIYECGLGSGVISIELAQRFPDLFFSGWDISETAIQTTLDNMTKMNLTNMSVIRGDFFPFNRPLDASGCAVLVSNPPYISELDYINLDPVVKKEPKSALVATDDGYSIIKRLIDLAIEQSMVLLCEIGFQQRALLMAQYPELLKFGIDDSGHDRFVYYFPPNVNCSPALFNKLRLH